MSPFIPHFSAECLNNINQEKINWPTVSIDELVEEKINFVVQINGKKRGIINLTSEISESELIIKIKNNPLINKFINNEELKKTIYIKNKLINLII